PPAVRAVALAVRVCMLDLSADRVGERLRVDAEDRRRPEKSQGYQAENPGDEGEPDDLSEHAQGRRPAAQPTRLAGRPSGRLGRKIPMQNGRAPGRFYDFCCSSLVDWISWASSSSSSAKEGPKLSTGVSSPSIPSSAASSSSSSRPSSLGGSIG